MITAAPAVNEEVLGRVAPTLIGHGECPDTEPGHSPLGGAYETASVIWASLVGARRTGSCGSKLDYLSGAVPAIEVSCWVISEIGGQRALCRRG